MSDRPVRSRFSQHIERWQHCTACPLCETRQKVVLARGKLPCDVLFVGEAPGECISGDTLIDTAFRDKRRFPAGIPVQNLVDHTGFQVYSYDVENRQLVLGTVKQVWKTGYKRLYEVTYSWWRPLPGGRGGRKRYFRSIRVTANHPFLLHSGEYRSIDQGLEVGNRLRAFYRFVSGRRHRVGLSSGDMRKEAVLLLEAKLGRPLSEGEQAHHDDRNPENDSWNNLVCLHITDHARLHGFEDNPMAVPEHRETHRKVMESEEYRSAMSGRMKDVLADPETYAARLEQIQRDKGKIADTVREKFRTDPTYYYRYLKGKRFRNGFGYKELEIERKFKEKFPNVEYPPEDNHQIVSIKKLGVADVYDMKVEKYHNFAANGVFVHNSEDCIGAPFVGPAGQLLDGIVRRAFSGLEPCPRHAFTNLVCCIPRDEATGGKTAQPEHEDVLACQVRLEEFVWEVAKPKLVVAVGKLAEDYLDQGYKHSLKLPKGTKQISITHPAAILRMSEAQRGLAAQRCEIALQDAVEEL